VITLINIIVLMMILYVFSVQISLYNELVFNQYRFKYFAIRDQLALLVIDGEIEEQSWEYQDIINVINYHINNTENMSIHNRIRLIKCYNQPQDSQVFCMVKRKISHPKVMEIMIDFFDTTSAIIKRNSGMQLKVIQFLLSMKKKPSLLEQPEIRKTPEIEFARNTQSALAEVARIREVLTANLSRLKMA